MDNHHAPHSTSTGNFSLLDALMVGSQKLEEERSTILGRLGVESPEGIVLNGTSMHLAGAERVNGCVYVQRGLGGAAIDISATEDLVIDTLYRQMKPAFDRIANPDTTSEGLLGLVATVSARLPYNNAIIDDINREDGYLFADKTRQNIRSLGYFVGRAGVCSHQSLLTTSLLERAASEEVIDCKPHFVSTYSRRLGSHAYCLVTSVSGDWILDPAAARRSDKIIAIDHKNAEVIRECYMSIR